MAIAYFESLTDCDVIELDIIASENQPIPTRLFVDSGFTGASCLILPEEYRRFSLATIMASQASGALQGRQDRILLTCRIPSLSFERNVIAVATDVSSLSLPSGVDGMVGLSFLRQFERWGAERTRVGSWRFFVADNIE